MKLPQLLVLSLTASIGTTARVAFDGYPERSPVLPTHIADARQSVSKHTQPERDVKPTSIPTVVALKDEDLQSTTYYGCGRPDRDQGNDQATPSSTRSEILQAFGARHTERPHSEVWLTRRRTPAGASRPPPATPTPTSTRPSIQGQWRATTVDGEVFYHTIIRDPKLYETLTRKTYPIDFKEWVKTYTLTVTLPETTSTPGEGSGDEYEEESGNTDSRNGPVDYDEWVASRPSRTRTPTRTRPATVTVTSCTATVTKTVTKTKTETVTETITEFVTVTVYHSGPTPEPDPEDNPKHKQWWFM